MPALGSFDSELYEDLGPLAWADPQNGYALAAYCGAIGTMFNPVRTLARADDMGNPGWSILLDINRCPTAYLPWLGQFVGVPVDSALTDAQQRSQIQNETGMSRGSVPTIISTAQKYLTGSQTVVVLERTPTPYSYTVITYTSETSNPTVVQNALTLAKPGGLKLTYLTVSGQVWAQLVANYATWAAVITAFPNWADVVNNTP